MSSSIDQVLIDRALGGERVQLSITERREAVRQAQQRGLSYTETADRLHIGVRMVERDLRAVGA